MSELCLQVVFVCGLISMCVFDIGLFLHIFMTFVHPCLIASQSIHLFLSMLAELFCVQLNFHSEEGI